MVIYVLLITLIIEFMIAYISSRHIIVSPTCIISGVFIIATIDLIRNIEYWEVELGWGTYIVIAGGIACFLLASLTAKYIYQAFKPYKSTINSSSIQLIRMRRWKVYISTLFCGVIFLLLFKYIRNFSGSGNIASIISSYRIASLKGEIQFPTVINLLNKVLVASGYIWIYILINNYLILKKIDLFLAINIILVLMSYFITGARGKMIYLILSAIPIFFFLWCSKNGEIRKLRFKYLVRIIIVLLIIAFVFRATANIMGRTITLDLMQHLSVNLSAPILNIDTFIKKKWVKPTIWGYNTFGYFISTLGRNFGISKWVYIIDLPFQVRNGHALGNVYTTFYSYYYYFHYIGVYVLSAIMGFISQISFETCRVSCFKIKKIKLSVILYSNIFITLAFSFFSNKFYETFVTFSFIQMMIIWSLLIWGIEKVNIKLKWTK